MNRILYCLLIHLILLGITAKAETVKPIHFECSATSIKNEYNTYKPSVLYVSVSNAKRAMTAKLASVLRQDRLPGFQTPDVTLNGQSEQSKKSFVVKWKVAGRLIQVRLTKGKGDQWIGKYNYFETVYQANLSCKTLSQAPVIERYFDGKKVGFLEIHSDAISPREMRMPF